MAYTSRLELIVDARSGVKSLRSMEDRLHGVERAGDRAEGSVRGMSTSLGGLRTVALAAGGALSALGISQLSTDIFQTIQTTEKLRASLVTVTGSIESANSAWDQMREFAKTTPFELEQSIQGFIRMKSLGLDPTESAMRSFANTAAAMNTDLMQMVEAVADATVGEFERLREYGIRASQDGDRVALTFQGVTTDIGNNAREIQRYLENIGNTSFADAAIDQMDTLGGKANNLGDSIDELYRAIGEAGATDLFNAALDGSDDAVDLLTNNVELLASGVGLLGDAAILAGGIFAGRFVGSIAAATGAKLAATGQALAYQRALARMAGASTAAAVSQTALAGAARGASAALMLVGGPAGAALLAVGAIYYFREELGLTQQAIGYTEEELASLRQEMADMDGVQITQTLSQVEDALMQVGLKAAAAREELAQLRSESGGSGALGFEGGRVGEEIRGMQAVAEYTEKMTELDQKRSVMQEELTSRTEEGTTAMDDMTVTAERLTGETESLGKAAGETADKTYTLTDAYDSLLDRITPNRREARQYAQDLGVLNLALASGRMNTQEYMQAMGLLQESFQAAQRDTSDLADTVDTESEGMATMFERQLERMDDAAVDTWRSFIDGSENAFGSFKRLALDTLAEVIHAFTTKRIVAFIGLGASGSAMASGGGGMGDLMSMGSNAYQSLTGGIGSIQWGGVGSASSYGGTGFANAATSSLGQTGFMGGSLNNFSGLQGIGSLGAGAAGGYLGTKAGAALFGKEAGSSFGATAGAVIGTYFGGPLGAFAGGTIGGALDSLFGSGRKSYGQIGSQIGGDRNAGDGVYRYDRNDRSMGWAQDSALGTIGVTKKQKTDDDALIGMVDAFVEIDNTLASVMTAAQLEQTRSALDGWESSRTANIGGIVDERLSAVLNATDTAFTDALSQFEGEELVQGLVGGLQVQNVGAQMAAAVAADMNAELLTALGNGSDIQTATQSILSSVQAVQVLGGAVDRLNLQFDATATGALSAAGNLASLVGGTDSLNSLLSGYYDAFYTEQEKFDNLASDLSSTFGDMGRELPSTREGVRNLVESLQLMGSAGQQQLATVLQTTPALTQYVTAMEEQRRATDETTDSTRALADIARERTGLELELLRLQGNAAELRRREMAGIDDSNKGLQQSIYILEHFESVAGRAAGNTEAMLASYMSYIESGALTLEQVLERMTKNIELAASATATQIFRSGGYDASLAAFTEYNAQIDAIDSVAQANEERYRSEIQAIETLSSLADSLALSGQSILDPAERLQEAQRQFAELQVRAENGDTDAIVQLQGASSQYLDAAASYYGQSSNQYAEIFGDVTDGVEDLERQFNASTDSLGSIELTLARQHIEQVRARETLYSQLSTQVDTLYGINSMTDLLETLPDHLADKLAEILLKNSGPSGMGEEMTGGSSGSSGARGFDEAAYLNANPDVAAAVADPAHHLTSGREHYLNWGINEDRKWATGGAFTNGIAMRPTAFDMNVMGEAGAEAIMPLSNVGGSLGVNIAGAVNLEPLARELAALRQEVAMLRSERRMDAEKASSLRTQQLGEQKKINKNVKIKERIS